MYHTMLPSHMMIQIVGGEQTNGLCPPMKTHCRLVTDTKHNRNYMQQDNRMSIQVPNGDGQNRHRLIQRTVYPTNIFGAMSVEIPLNRRSGYSRQNNIYSNGNNLSGSWPRRNINNNNNGNNSYSTPSPHFNYRPNNNTGTIKKPNWNNNKYYKRNNNNNNTNRNQSTLVQNELNNYNSDSGISSRSPTPSKQTPDRVLVDSSDDRESVSSSVERLLDSPGNTIQNVAALPPQGYTSQHITQQQYNYKRTYNYHHNSYSNNTRKSDFETNQGKKRYSGKSTPPMQKNQRQRKYADVIVPSINIYSKFSIVSNRWESHSVYIPSYSPSYQSHDLIVPNQSDPLSEEIWNKFIDNQQTDETFKKKSMLRRYVASYLKSIYPKYALHLVGSTINGFGSNSSDVDMCLLSKNEEFFSRDAAITILQNVMFHLQRRQLSHTFENIELIPAKVPILRFHDKMHNLDVDLNFNNTVSIWNTHLLAYYSKFDWRVKPLVLVVKLWAQIHDINDAKSMTISSYSLVLMVIHFLQCGVSPSVLPCLQSMFEEEFNAHSNIQNIDLQKDLILPQKSPEETNNQTLGELLHDFLKYYTFFNYKTYAISVRTGKRLLISDCILASAGRCEPNSWTHLCIEEPYNLINTARSVYDLDEFLRIRSVFRWSYKTLHDKGSLSSIFVNHFPRPKSPLSRS